uniref:Serpentine Receptor, class H n=1 Tax=Caenorhabditis tropicalis TaxID=1561998 RepID=A0A1I7UWP9_9PELO
MDSPEFLSTSLHTMTCLEVPVHLFGAYCILFKTPISMKSVKFSMLNLHFWSVFLDLAISLLTSPYVFFPALVGKSLGLLEYFNVSIPIQLYLIVTLFPTVGVSITAILENRFYLLFARDTFWKYLRIPFLGFLYLASWCCFIPSLLNIPDQKEALEEILEKMPIILKYANVTEIFVLSTDYREFFFTLIIMIALVTVTSVTFAFLLHWNMKKRSKLVNVSIHTLHLQKIFFTAIFIQTSMPILILIFPLNYLAFSMFTEYFNQAINNICFIITAFHGLLSTIIMIIVHKPYREVFYIVFCEKVLRILKLKEGSVTYSMSSLSRPT